MTQIRRIYTGYLNMDEHKIILLRKILDMPFPKTLLALHPPFCKAERNLCSSIQPVSSVCLYFLLYLSGSTINKI